MNRTLQQVLENDTGNYILPFFWQHGESEEVLRKYMGVIQDANINEVCLEARPHPDFAGPGWWHDVDILLDEARRRGMRVWILDDAHFPTGQAAGKMIEHDISLQKQYIMFQMMEVNGPTPQMSFDILAAVNWRSPFADMAGDSVFNQDPFKTWYEDNSLVKVVAYPYTSTGRLAMDGVELTGLVDEKGQFTWDVPEGKWAVYIYYLTRNGGGKCGYINMVSDASCQVQIEEVYEPHYEHYRQYFGNVLAGFFSDEPCIGNCIGFDFDEIVGKKKMPLPWSEELSEALRARLGEDWGIYMAALWMDMEDKARTAKVRYAYMDIVSRLVARCFSRKLGDWCQERGVEYIGHIVEDKNQHARLGSSQGHFFRAMEGQHMSGIDDIGGQVMPEGEHVGRRGFAGAPGASGEFYHFELGKLGTSYAHIDPRKQGRTMCEIFGAYGWSEGVHLEKYLTDHFLVRGVNRFVPHAFSGKDFPDPDCPPHFYAHGNNPQYRHFGKLMGYMNRMCHVINDGRSVAPAAVLYHGEAEWAGKCMLNESVCAELMENQIDLDILPSDVFVKREHYKTDTTKGLSVNGNVYRVFIIPYAEYITEAVARFVIEAGENDYPVIFVEDYPSGISDLWEDDRELVQAVKESGARTVALGDLACTVREMGLAEISIVPEYKQLRYYHYEKEDAVFYVLNNESTGKTYAGEITLPWGGQFEQEDVVLYEAMKNRLYHVPVRVEGDRLYVDLQIAPYEEVVLVLEKGIGNRDIPVWKKPRTVIKAVEGPWKISVAEALQYPEFTAVGEIEILRSFGELRPNFSGFIAYENTFLLEEAAEELVMTITDAYEGVEVWVNGQNAGMAITRPYEFEIGSLVMPGENQLRIEVATTLQRKMSGKGDMMAMLTGVAPMEPTGLVGEVLLERYTR